MRQSGPDALIWSAGGWIKYSDDPGQAAEIQRMEKADGVLAASVPGAIWRQKYIRGNATE